MVVGRHGCWFGEALRTGCAEAARTARPRPPVGKGHSPSETRHGGPRLTNQQKGYAGRIALLHSLHQNGTIKHRHTPRAKSDSANSKWSPTEAIDPPSGDRVESIIMGEKVLTQNVTSETATMFRTNAKTRRHRIGLEPLEARELLSGSPSQHAIIGGDATPGAAVPITLHLATHPRRPATTSTWPRSTSS